MNRTRLVFVLIAAVLIASRLCHVGILWEGDTLPLAAAGQMRYGKQLYRDIWFDKPPLTAAVYLLCGARAGAGLRLAGALYALIACGLAYAFARRLWSEREALWAAVLLAFFLTFDVPSSVIPVASDLLMLAPHLAAVWMAYERRPFWSGVLAGLAFWISPKGLFVAIVCVAWNPAGLPLMAAGFASVSGVAAAWLWSTGALASYWDEVWRWGRLYTQSTSVDAPLKNGLLRTMNWSGFHAAAVLAAILALVRATPRAKPTHPSALPTPADSTASNHTAPYRAASERFPWLAWLAIAFIGVAMGLRFFPRYYFLLLPPVILLAARGMAIQPRLAFLLAIPLVRFAPGYWAAVAEPDWRDIRMDRDSRAAAQAVRQLARPGDTLFIWGYRPEIYTYTGLPAATMYLDSQPLTGVPADRHLTQSEPVETSEPAARRAELARARPAFILDGLGLYNPRLAIGTYPELREWLGGYREIARVGGAVIYRLSPARGLQGRE